MVGTKSFVHRARKTKWSESPDIDQNFAVKGFIKKHFGIILLTDEVIQIPAGGYMNFRRPDLYNKKLKLVVELDGHGFSGKHGWGEIKTTKDERKDADYKLAGVKVCHVNSAQTDGYEEKLVIKILQDSGVFT